MKNHDAAPDYATERGESALMKAAANGHWESWHFGVLPLRGNFEWSFGTLLVCSRSTVFSHA